MPRLATVNWPAPFLVRPKVLLPEPKVLYSDASSVATVLVPLTLIVRPPLFRSSGFTNVRFALAARSFRTSAPGEK